MDGWKSIVFETPTDCFDWKSQNPDLKANFPTDTFCVHREDARRESRPTENVTQIIIEDQQSKNLITPPYIPPQNENPEEEKEEEKNLNQEENTSSTKILVESNNSSGYLKEESLSLNPQPINPCRTNTSVNQKDVTLTSLANKSCLEEKESAGVVLTQTLVKRTTKADDSALGIKPPEEQKNLQARFNSWIPDGVWKVNGKLDPNFVDWLALDWQKAYGGDLHKKRADVLRHFKKDPANIAISWTQYEAETRHRYENAAVRMHNGMAIAPEEQQQLISRSRAFCEKMSDEVNPVAVDVSSPNYFPQIEASTEENIIECHHEVKPVNRANNERVISSNNLFFQVEVESSAEEINLVDSSQSSERSERVASSNPPKGIPRNEKGGAENPEAYRLWQPEKLEGEQVNPVELRERLAALSQRFAMAKPVKEKKQPTDPIEELNEWLADPVLRNTAMSKIMKSDSLSVEET